MSAAHESTHEGTVHQSRWGFHPIDRETFAKLKLIHKHYWKTLRQLARWYRWNNKQPQNRIITQRIRDEAGRVVGRQVIGVWEEPAYCTAFGLPLPHRHGIKIPDLLPDGGIVAAYNAARKPVDKDKVTPICITLEIINRLYEELTNRSRHPKGWQ